MAGKLLSQLTQISSIETADLFPVQKDGESTLKYSTVAQLMEILASGGVVLATPTVGKTGVSTTPVKITEYDSTLPSTSPSGLTLDAANGRITITNAGLYMVVFTLAAIQDTAGTAIYRLTSRKNGVALPQVTSTIYTSTSSDYFSRSFTFLLDISATDYLEVFIECTTGTENITIEMLQFFVRRLQ